MNQNEQQRLVRLFSHLRMGGTRKGACGWASMTWNEFNARLAGQAGFAEMVESAESLGLARDEQRLNARVVCGDRASLLSRLRAAHTRVERMEKGAGERPRNESDARFEEIRREICCLTPEERKELARAVREDPALAAPGA